ncbi:MAG: 30S ribosome-binding factor RbfA [Anaerolineae bacterium]|nr:30S ribosome-binding factor RbfA [Anaerolineae bacterium]
MSSRRQLRVAELVQRELAEMVTFELRDPRLSLVNITRVRVSPDLKYANVYITSLGDEAETAEAIDGLTNATGFLRTQLGQRTKLRYVPDLAFHIDEALLESRRINELLDSLAIEADNAELVETSSEDDAAGDA